MAIGVFEFLLGAVIVGGISSVLTAKHNVERERIKARGAQSDEEGVHGIVGDLHQDVSRLKERVQVLERLVTDDERKLSDEISRLEPRNGAPVR